MRRCAGMGRWWTRRRACAHPAVVEARQQRLALARLLAALRLPAGAEDDLAAGRRPQRRVGVRGFYGPRSVLDAS
jgi:hypothetical protein